MWNLYLTTWGEIHGVTSFQRCKKIQIRVSEFSEFLSPVVRTHAFTAEDAGSVPDQGTK